ncbi:hypothetical protein ACLMJK_001572 [Lecanora helva]
MAPSSPQNPIPQTDYPAITKQAAAVINGKPTDVTSTQFLDKIMITISQDGRLAQWVHVPLETQSPNFGEQYIPSESNDDSLLPLPYLSPKTLLGGSTSERETVGHLYASQIASAIVARHPEETRTVLVGLGLTNLQNSREVFYDIIDLVLRCL